MRIANIQTRSWASILFRLDYTKRFDYDHYLWLMPDLFIVRLKRSFNALANGLYIRQFSERVGAYMRG